VSGIIYPAGEISSILAMRDSEMGLYTDAASVGAGITGPSAKTLELPLLVGSSS